MNKPLIAVTFGDASGIGPELVARPADPLFGAGFADVGSIIATGKVEFLCCAR